MSHAASIRRGRRSNSQSVYCPQDKVFNRLRNLLDAAKGVAKSTGQTLLALKSKGLFRPISTVLHHLTDFELRVAHFFHCRNSLRFSHKA
jgi:hypothetical protein